MPLDREDTLKKAEKLLRQGRLDGAIAEYLRVVEDQPRDWNTANTLGDLYVRANQADKAVAQYARIADHFFQDGFYPKAAALYKKILKIVPDNEESQLHLADISVKLGLLADAKSYLTAVAARRRARRDTRGADEIVVRLGAIDPADIDARLAGARVLVGVRRRSGRRDAVPGSLQRPAREGARARGDAGPAGGRAVQSRRSREPRDPGQGRGGGGRLPRRARLSRSRDGGAGSRAADGARRYRAALRPARTGHPDSAAAAQDRPGAAPQGRRARLGALRVESGGRLRLRRGGGRCVDVGVGIRRCGLDSAGVRHAGAHARPGAAQARRDLRRRRARVDDVRGAGAADRRLPGRQPGGRSAGHRRRSRRQRAVGGRAHRTVSPRARHAPRVRARHGHRGAAERADPVHGERPFLGPGARRAATGPAACAGNARTGACRRGREGEGAGSRGAGKVQARAARSRSI